MEENRIEILVGRQSDGVSYNLQQKSIKRILASYPDARPVRRVFVGFDTKEAFENIHGPITQQVIIMLTGLSEEKLQKMGDVVLVDSASGDVL